MIKKQVSLFEDTLKDLELLARDAGLDFSSYVRNILHREMRENKELLEDLKKKANGKQKEQ